MANVTIEIGIVLLMPAQEADEWHRRIVACYGTSCLPLTSVTNSASTGGALGTRPQKQAHPPARASAT